MRYFYIFFLCQNIVLGQFVGLRDEIENADEKNIDDLIPNKKEPSTGSAYDADQSEPGNEAYVEVLIVVDKKLSEMVSDAYSYGIWNRNKSISWLNAGNKIQDRILYFKKFISAVNFRFQTNFVNPSIQLTISGFLHGNPSFVTPPKDDENAINSVTTLHHMSFVFGFAKFRKDHNFDIVLFLTEKKICKYETCKGYQKLTGTSYTEGACMDIKATEQGLTHGVAIVQDFGAFSGVDTAAREIGRLLGAKDDGDNNPCSSDDGYIMSNLRSKKTLSKGNAYKFSKCSVKSIKIFLKTPQAKSCLFTDPQLFSSYRTLPWRELVAPHVPSLGDQCSVSKTPEGISAVPSLCGENPCQVLECVSGTDCLAFLPAIDGSRCNNQGSVCYQGECVQKDTSTSEDQWWAGKCLIKGAGKFLPIGAYVNAWDCLDRCQSAQIEGKPDYYTACEYSRAKGECQVYTGQIEHPVGEFTWSSKSMCYIFKKGGEGTGSTVTGGHRFAGYCLDSNGKYQNPVGKPSRKTIKYVTADDCLRACNNPSGPFYLVATGCEYYAPKNMCSVHTAEVVSGSGSSKWTCFVLKKKESPGKEEKTTKYPGNGKTTTSPCFLDEDIDYPGMDLNLATGSTSDRKKSALECRALCNETPLCKFFTWKAKINECWIKDGISRKENQIGATSGSACREGDEKKKKDTESPGKEEKTTKSPGKSRCNKNPSTPKSWGEDKLFIDCPIEWTTFDRRCYKFLFTNEPQDLTFAKSLQYCVDLFPDVKLVEIDSQHQQQWIEKQIQIGNYDSKNKIISQPFHISKPQDIEIKQKRNEEFYFGPISGVTPVPHKLNDRKICMAAVYDPLLCIAPWQYVQCSATMNVKNIVCMFEQKQKGGSPTDHGPYDKIWTDDQCPNLGRGSRIGKLKNCEYSCLVTPKCTAIHFSPSDCVLRACPTPVPKPKWKHLNYRGYTVLRYPGSTTDPLTKGPFDQIWTDEQCPNLGQGSKNGNLEDCKNACHFHIKCNAVNFSSKDCVLRACPISIPTPKWNYRGYKGYST